MPEASVSFSPPIAKKQLEWNAFPYRETEPYIDRACRRLETKLFGKVNPDGTETPKDFSETLSLFDQEKVDPKKTKLKINKEGKEYAQSLYELLLKDAGSEENVIYTINAFREESFIIGEDGSVKRKFLDSKIKQAFPDDPTDKETVRLKRRAFKKLLGSVASRARRDIKDKEEATYKQKAVADFKTESETDNNPNAAEVSKRVKALKDTEKKEQEEQARLIAESIQHAQQVTKTANEQQASKKGPSRRGFLKIVALGGAIATVALLAPEVTAQLGGILADLTPTPDPKPAGPPPTATAAPENAATAENNQKQKLEEETKRLKADQDLKDAEAKKLEEEATRLKTEQDAKEAARKLDEELKKKRENSRPVSEQEKALAKKAEEVINAYFVNIDYKGTIYRIPVSFGENGTPRQTLKGTTKSDGHYSGKGLPEEVAADAQKWVKTKEFQDYVVLAEQKIKEKTGENPEKQMDVNVFLSRILADNGFFMDCSGTVVAVVEQIYQELGLDFNAEIKKQRGFTTGKESEIRAANYIAPSHFEEFLKPVIKDTTETITTIVQNKLSEIHTGDVIVVHNSNGDPVHSIVVISNDVRTGKLITAQSSDVTVGPEVHIGPHFTEFTYLDPDAPLSSARTKEVVWEGDYGWDADANYAALQGQEMTIRLKGVKIVRFRSLEQQYITRDIMAPRTESKEELQILINEKVLGVETPVLRRIKPGMIPESILRGVDQDRRA